MCFLWRLFRNTKQAGWAGLGPDRAKGEGPTLDDGMNRNFILVSNLDLLSITSGVSSGGADLLSRLLSDPNEKPTKKNKDFDVNMIIPYYFYRYRCIRINNSIGRCPHSGLIRLRYEIIHAMLKSGGNSTTFLDHKARNYGRIQNSETIRAHGKCVSSYVGISVIS
ncbi:uncharacterized protein LOC111254373 [Varroa destructor]|uniref:Uncharacterized protein n=1 Tax=Varroa destructor TaxID=109461 RepID=A0A7M7KUF3_VARDE|nr:uncharacterized protein LOC111254373 [Varroa destructor]